MTNHVSKTDLCASIGSAPLCDQFDIFSVPPASRASDPITSKIAGERFDVRNKSGKLSELQQQVLAAFKLVGPMMGETVENLPAFKRYAPSTIRKRITELKDMNPPRLVEYGMGTNSRGKLMTIWAIKP